MTDPQQIVKVSGEFASSGQKKVTTPWVPWTVAALSLVFLAGVVAADAVLPGRYVLIQFYGLAPLIAAVALDPRWTAGVGLVAVAAALISGQVHEGNLDSQDVLLRVGSVAASGVAAVAIAAFRQSRERQMAEVVEVAEVAQQAILRTDPMALPDLEVATIYRSATIGATVGGDLYEGVSSRFGSRLIIGDARGKGLEAVRLAAVVLGAFRHGALVEPDLGRLVADLDQTVAAFSGEEDFVTALVIEVSELDVRMVACGHPAPLIGPPDYVRPIDLEPGLPLGLGGRRPVIERRWPTRQILVAYTDGLVEARDDQGRMLDIETLASAVNTSEPAEAIADFVSKVTRHVGGDLKDDLTILAMTRTAR